MSRFRHYTFLTRNAVLALYVFTALFILCVGAYYCNPNSEDYSLSQTPRDMGINQAVTNLLITYDGRYFTNILHSINPLAFYWVGGYKFMPVVGIILFVAAFFFVSKPVVSNNGFALLLFIAVISCLYFQLTTSLPHLVYWMVSSFVYLWPWSFTFLFIGCLYRYELSQSNITKFIWGTLSMATLICAIGMNEMFLPLHTIILFGMFLRSWLFKKNLPEIMPVILTGVICLFFFVTSPGISVRAADNRMKGYFYLYPPRVLESLVHYLLFTVRLFTNPILIVSALAVAPLLLNLVPNHNFFRLKNSLVGILTLLSVSYLMLLPFYLTMQTEPGVPQRIYSTITLLHILAFIWFASAVVAKNSGNSTTNSNVFQSEIVSLALSVCFIVLLFTTPNKFKDIITEWRSNVLYKFDTQMQCRFAQIEEARKAKTCYKTVVFAKIETYPTSNYITPDLPINRAEPYWNEAWEAYFNIDEIKLSGDSVSKFKYQ